MGTVMALTSGVRSRPGSRDSSIQSLATYFPGLRPQWKQNCDEERLLGVDITGQMDSPATHDPEVMRELRQVVAETNRELAARLGINQSAAVTTVKPSGNSSQLLNCSSGLHARWAPYYERNVRVAATSPIFKVLRDAGVAEPFATCRRAYADPRCRAHRAAFSRGVIAHLRSHGILEEEPAL